MPGNSGTMTTATPDPAHNQKTNNTNSSGLSAANGAPASGDTPVVSRKAKRNNNKKKNKKRKKAAEAAAAAAAAAATATVTPARDVHEDSTPIDTPASSGAATDVEADAKPKQDGDKEELNGKSESKASNEVVDESIKKPQSGTRQATKESSNGPLVVSGETGPGPSSVLANSRKFDFDWADDGMEEDEGMPEGDKGHALCSR